MCARDACEDGSRVQGMTVRDVGCLQRMLGVHKGGGMPDGVSLWDAGSAAPRSL